MIVAILVAAFTLPSAFTRGTIHKAEFSEAAGLQSGDLVTIAGVEAGRVETVELAGDRVLVTFDVEDAWVGVGSVCKRQGDPGSIVAVLDAIHQVRPDLRLHGFGVKLTALKHPAVRAMLWSADSMAWSYSARKQGRDGNSSLEAQAFEAKVLAANDLRGVWQPTLAIG